MFVFCSLCDQSYHPGSQCMSPAAALEMLRERATGNKNAAAEYKLKVPLPPHPPALPIRSDVPRLQSYSCALWHLRRTLMCTAFSP